MNEQGGFHLSVEEGGQKETDRTEKPKLSLEKSGSKPRDTDTDIEGYDELGEDGGIESLLVSAISYGFRETPAGEVIRKEILAGSNDDETILPLLARYEDSHPQPTTTEERIGQLFASAQIKEAAGRIDLCQQDLDLIADLYSEETP